MSWAGYTAVLDWLDMERDNTWDVATAAAFCALETARSVSSKFNLNKRRLNSVQIDGAGIWLLIGG